MYLFIYISHLPLKSAPTATWWPPRADWNNGSWWLRAFRVDAMPQRLKFLTVEICVPLWTCLNVNVCPYLFKCARILQQFVILKGGGPVVNSWLRFHWIVSYFVLHLASSASPLQDIQDSSEDNPPEWGGLQRGIFVHPEVHLTIALWMRIVDTWHSA